jgi:ERCC4-type nuclease
MELHIDNRELKLKDLLSDIITDTSNLDHGDIHILFKGDLLLLIERKTISDLWASLSDGRYRNQKKILLETYPTKILYYIIEGFNDDKTIISCMLNTMIRDNIKVFQTGDINDTCILLRNIYERISNNPEKYINNVNNEKQIVKAKNKDITLTQMFESILHQIPGISNKTAKALSNKYISFKDFYDSLNALDDLEKDKILKEIKLDNNKRISSSVSLNIIKYIFK